MIRMIVKVVAVTTVVVVGVAAGLGCVEVGQPGGSLPPAVARSTQSCFDGSGSYSFVDPALQTFREVLPHYAEPGAVFYPRWILENSYRPEAAIRLADGRYATTELPNVDPEPEPPEAFSSPVVVREYEEKLALVQRQRTAFDAALSAFIDQMGDVVPPARSDGTDVFGCIAKACELLEPGDVLWIASDLEDNVGRTAECDLSGVAVAVTLFECGTPCPEKRFAWALFFDSLGAASVIYLDPSLTAAQVASKLQEVRDGN